ncbi:MAG: hypothetical protein ACTSVU_07165 [Promethearchaeota archaeon]
MLSLSLAFEYLVIWHKESNGIIFAQEVPNEKFDPVFLETVRQSVFSGKIRFPKRIGQISHALIKHKYILMRAGQYCIIFLILKSAPINSTHDALENFSVRLESRWESELKTLYSDLEGNLSIFQQDTQTRPSLIKLVIEVFGLQYRGKFIPIEPAPVFDGIKKKVWNFAEELARESGEISLGDLLLGCDVVFSKSINRSIIEETILDFVNNGFLLLKIN